MKGGLLYFLLPHIGYIIIRLLYWTNSNKESERRDREKESTLSGCIKEYTQSGHSQIES